MDISRLETTSPHACNAPADSLPYGVSGPAKRARPINGARATHAAAFLASRPPESLPLEVQRPGEAGICVGGAPRGGRDASGGQLSGRGGAYKWACRRLGATSLLSNAPAGSSRLDLRPAAPPAAPRRHLDPRRTMRRQLLGLLLLGSLALSMGA